MKKLFKEKNIDVTASTSFDEYDNGSEAAVALELGKNHSFNFAVGLDGSQRIAPSRRLEVAVKGNRECNIFLKALNFIALELHRRMHRGFTFSHALELMKDGACMTRLGWNGKGMTVQIQFPDEKSANSLPYIYMVIPAGSSKQFGENGDRDHRVPWLASQTDMLAEDWVEIL